MSILNLTQHEATLDQIAAGVAEPTPALKANIQELLTFDDPPAHEEMRQRAEKLADIAVGHPTAMIGGAPFFMRHLEDALANRGTTPVYAFSKREVIEVKNDDGVVVKKAVFKHLDFIPGGTTNTP